MFEPMFHFYTLFELSKESQVCKYYIYRIMTSIVLKNYWKSKEDEWNEEVTNPSKKGEIIEVEASLSSSKACYDTSSMKRRACTSWWIVQYGPSPMIASKFLYKLKSLKREPHLFNPCGKSKFILVQIIHYIIHLV